MGKHFQTCAADGAEAFGTPVIFVSARSIPAAIYAAMREVLAQGRRMRTAYDRKEPEGNYIDPPSMDVR